MDTKWQSPLPSGKPTAKPSEVVKYTPFRTASKIKSLSQRGLIESKPYYELHPIPRYKATKKQKLSYSHVHGIGTWRVDVSYYRNKGEVIQDTNDELGEREIKGKIALLICIHCNSRFVYADFLKDGSSKTIVPILKALSQSNFPCDTIISDAERSISAAIKQIPKIRGHIIYNMNDNQYANHSMLAIIDRFTRTFRDMLFTANLDLNSQTLKELLVIYNKTPHSTLSKVMGFETTPLDMIRYLPLQEEYIKRVMLGNISKYGALTNSFNVGDIVYVYQPPMPLLKRRNTVMDYPFKITDIKGGRYYLKCLKDGKEIQRPRSYLIKRGF